MSAAHVRLDRFRLLAYRSCRDTQFSTNEGVTALIGPNGAGKTNLLHGIMLLSLSTRRVSRIMEDTYTRQCKVEAEFVVKTKPVSLRATVTYRPTDQNRDEIVSVEETWNFKSIDAASPSLSGLDFYFFGKGASFSRAVPAHLRYSYEHALHNLSFRERRRLLVKRSISKKIIAAYELIQRFRAGINYYSASQFTNPSLCPTSIEIDEEGDLTS